MRLRYILAAPAILFFASVGAGSGRQQIAPAIFPTDDHYAAKQLVKRF